MFYEWCRMRARDKLFAITVAFVILLPACGFVSLVYAKSGQLTLKPTDDTFTDSRNAILNYGGQSTLDISTGIQSNGYPYSALVWLKFSLSSVPSGIVIDGATLQLYASSVSGNMSVVALSCPDNTWTELTLKYSNMPGTGFTPSNGSALVSTSNRWYYWNIEDVVRNTLNDTREALTIVLEPAGPSNTNPDIPQSGQGPASSVWVSKEAPVSSTDYAPRLIVDYTSPPAPTPSPTPTPTIPVIIIGGVVLLVLVILVGAFMLFRKRR